MSAHLLNFHNSLSELSEFCKKLNKKDPLKSWIPSAKATRAEFVKKKKLI